MMSASLERALQMAAVTGLRCALGPALVAQARRRPERHTLAMAALGEMVLDKLPLAPDRDTLLPLLARGAAGAWVAGQVADEGPGPRDPWAAPLGAAVAMGVAVAAPKVRKTLGWTTGMSQVLLGLAEDYLALKLGTRALGMSMDEVTGAAREVGDEVRGYLPAEMPEMPWAGWMHDGQGREAQPGRSQSAGAGSM